MAELTVQAITQGTSLTPSFAAAGASGDTFANNGKVFIYAKNVDAGASRTITIDSLVNCNQGSDHNATITIPLSSEEMAGPYSRERFNDTTGKVSMTYDDESDLTIAIISLN